MMKEFRVKVEVRLKPVVLDPQGKTILSALHNLGYSEVEETRVGKLIELKVMDSNPERVMERAREMCKNLLANPIIEDFDIKISGTQDT
jgi:phosphoribosylformylglycinamidine synthase